MVLNSRDFALISCTAAAARPAVSLLCSLVSHGTPRSARPHGPGGARDTSGLQKRKGPCSMLTADLLTSED